MAKKKDKETKPAKAKAEKPAKAKKAGKGGGGGFDSAKMKDFAMNYGERIGLGVAGFLMVIFLLYGLSLAFSAKSPHKEIQASAQALGTRVQSSEPGAEIANATMTSIEWAMATPNLRNPAMYFDPGAVGDNKVTNPTILPPGNPKLQAVVYRSPINPSQTSAVKFEFEVPRTSEKKTMVTDQIPIMQECQIDVLRGPVFQYYLRDGKVEYLKEAKGKKGTTPPVTTSENAGSAMGYLLTRHLEPARMVVIQTTFPYDQQLENYRKALRKDHVSGLFYAEDTIPWFNGLIVKRGELNGDNKPVNWKEWAVVVGVDGKYNVVMQPKLKDFLQQAVLLDEPAPNQLAKVGATKVDPMAGNGTGVSTMFPKEIQPGLVMPLPRLAFGDYPKVDLPDIKLVKGSPTDPNMATPTDPGMTDPAAMDPAAKLLQGITGATGGKTGDPKGPALAIDYLEYKKLAEKEYTKAARFLGRLYQPTFKFGFYPFYPTGEYISTKKFYGIADTKGTTGGQPVAIKPGGTEIPGFGAFPTDPMDPMATNTNTTETTQEIPVEDDPFKLNEIQEVKPNERKLIRFIDVDVQPGKTYIYSLQVRIANPNYKHPERVAFKALSDEKELLSPVVWTRPVVIGPEMQFFAVDQDLLDPKYLTSGYKGKGFAAVDKGVPVQMHRWVENFELVDSNETSGKLGAWVVADQVMAYRGEFLGQKEVPVQVPMWSSTKGFSLTPDVSRLKKYTKDKQPHAIVDFQPSDPPPLVVDYKGGRKAYPDQPGKYPIQDEGATQVLILSPGGKLELFDSNQDSNPRNTPQGPSRGLERAERFAAWQEMMDKMKKLTQPVNPNPMGGATGP